MGKGSPVTSGHRRKRSVLTVRRWATWMHTQDRTGGDEKTRGGLSNRRDFALSSHFKHEMGA